MGQKKTVIPNAAAEPVCMEQSFGNVKADLGLPDADEIDAKVRFAVEINRQIRKRGLTQLAAAKYLEVSQLEIHELKYYKLDKFSRERLISFVVALAPGC